MSLAATASLIVYADSNFNTQYLGGVARQASSNPLHRRRKVDMRKAARRSRADTTDGEELGQASVLRTEQLDPTYRGKY